MTSNHTQPAPRTGGEPRRDHRGVAHNLAVTAADGTRLLVDHHPPRPAAGVPADAVGGTVVWIRTAYGRKGMASFVKRFVKRGAHVLVEALRGTDGSGGTFDGIHLHPTDGADGASWLRRQDWFPGTIVTWGHSALGTAEWALAAAEVPEWRLAILHDTQSEARPTAFPGGVFASVMLGFVHSVDWLAKHPNGSMVRSLISEVRAARRLNKVLATLPLGTAADQQRRPPPPRAKPRHRSPSRHCHRAPRGRPGDLPRPRAPLDPHPAVVGDDYRSHLHHRTLTGTMSDTVTLLAQGISGADIRTAGAFVGGGLALAGGAIGAFQGDATVGAAVGAQLAQMEAHVLVDVLREDSLDAHLAVPFDELERD